VSFVIVLSLIVSVFCSKLQADKRIISAEQRCFIVLFLREANAAVFFLHAENQGLRLAFSCIRKPPGIF
jgi:hypothetical protein